VAIQTNSEPASKITRGSIPAPKFQRLHAVLVGTAPLVQARFSEKAKLLMRSKMLEGSRASKGKKRVARDFDDDFKQAFHRSEEGWVGVPCSAIRTACIDVCRMVGFKMTMAKMSIFVEADGFGEHDGVPLVKLDAPEAERLELIVRNQTGVPDIRVRPMWRSWSLKVRIRFDSDQFSHEDVVNLLARAGIQNGIGEGRPFSKESNGMGWGTFVPQPPFLVEDIHPDELSGKSSSNGASVREDNHA